MRTQAYKAKFNPAKAGLPSLRKKLEENRNKIEKLKTEISIIDPESIIKKYDAFQENIQKLHFKINELRKNRKAKSGLFATIFGETEITPEASAEIEKIENDIKVLSNMQCALNVDKARMQVASKNEIMRRSQYEEILLFYIEKHERKKEKLTNLKLKAAQNAKERRIMAAAIKRGVEITKNCPYCEVEIAESGHIDHIYPVSKGGQSVLRNMIFVCSSCNLKKGGLTLNAFIQKYSLDRYAIEKTLDSLGKEY